MLLDSFHQDVKQALRNLRNAPVFLAAVVLTLGIGIGATTTIFSIVKTVLLDPLPYPDADELLAIGGYPWNPAEIAIDLEESGDSFEDVAAFYPQQFAVTGGAEPYQLEGAQVTYNFLRLFQRRVSLGRDFIEGDAQEDAPPTAIISNHVWQHRYGGSRDAIGQAIQVNGEHREIIGVVEAGFRQLAPRSGNPGLWIPFELQPTNSDGLNDGINYVIPVVRLKNDVSLRQAQSELDVVMGRFKERHPDAADSSRWNLQWATLKSELIQNVRAALLVLQLAVIAILLIACTNVTNLLLARFNSRQVEVAIRSALGASRGRLFGQLLTESVVLSVLGGLAGLVLTFLVLELLLAVVPQDVARIDDVSIDPGVFLFLSGVSIATGLLIGAISVIGVSRLAPAKVLKDGGRTRAQPKRQRLIGQALVISEVALALVLLVSAGLLGRSFISLTGEAPGFRTENVLAVSVQIPQNRYQSMPELTDFYHQVLERLRQIPGIEAVGLSKNPPLSRGNSVREYQVEGEGETGTAEAQYDVISPAYFRALDIPLLRGRYLQDTDRRDGLPVAIIDEAMWRAAWPDQDPIGKRFRFADGWRTVVGVAGNVRGSGLANEPRPGFYISYRQLPDTPTELAVGHNVLVLIHSRVDATSMSESLRQGIWEVDPQQPIPDITTLESIVSQGVSPQRFRAMLLAIFAAIALILVIVGIYGVISYTVAGQTHEMGIRMALGARKGELVRRVIGRAIFLSGVGLLIGLAGAAALTRFLSSMLYGVSPMDPVTFATISGLLLAVAVLASYIPARRAARIAPMQVLRDE